MIHEVYKAEIKLNDADKDYTNYIVIKNDTGVLLVTEELFVISFNSYEEFCNEVSIKSINMINKIEM